MTSPVLVDDRAGSRDLIRYSPLDTTGELTRLDSADVAIVGEGPDGAVLVGVEVKSIWDVISSANTGRLQATQIPAMLSTYNVSWLLYYGEYRASPRDGSLMIEGKGGKWRQLKLGKQVAPYGFLEALLMDLACLGVHIKHAVDIREAAIWLGVLHRWWSKSWNKHKGMRTFDNSREMSLMPEMDAGTYLRARIAAQLPGVGYERAVSVARHFPSVLSMMSAGPAEWVRVPGIGKVIGNAVPRAIRDGE